MHLFILVFLEEKNKAYESCLTLKIFDQHVQKKHLTWKVLFTLCEGERGWAAVNITNGKSWTKWQDGETVGTAGKLSGESPTSNYLQK